MLHLRDGDHPVDLLLREMPDPHSRGQEYPGVYQELEGPVPTVSNKFYQEDVRMSIGVNSFAVKTSFNFK